MRSFFHLHNQFEANFRRGFFSVNALWKNKIAVLVGDFLFVSKFHYGARVPQTAVSFPMVHDTIVGTGIRSYLNKPQIPYFRLPGFEKIKRNIV